MTKEERVRFILTYVLSLNAAHGTTHFRATPTDPDVRVIKDDARWEAKIIRGAREDKSASASASSSNGYAAKGGKWDLFHLYVYEQLRVTSFFRDDEVDITLYYNGPWEKIFLINDSGDKHDITPGGANR